MSDLKVLEVDDANWSTVVSKCSKHDFYHTQSYHLLEKEHRPVLFTLNVDEIIIALPLILRKIPNSNYFDCTSAYGYVGPISNWSMNKVPLEIIKAFQMALLVYFRKHGIVSVLSRLHPLIETVPFFSGFGVLRDLNKTVAIDLNLLPTEQLLHYRKSTKSNLNQLRNKGFEVCEATAEDEIDAFVAIYLETMGRVKAAAMYFFDRDYFYRFLKSTDFSSKLLVAKFEGKIIAGAIFTILNGIMQYHLAGTAETHIKLTPMKLILDEARRLGNALNLDYLHLGGGVGGSDEDSLFRFKSGFSNYYCQYQVWQLILNQQKYDEFVIQNRATDKGPFFPLYRAT